MEGVIKMLFIKRHKILTIIFVLGIILMLKNSTIPYFYEPPTIVAIIFNRPTSDFFVGLIEMVNIFASAYVTSLVFFYMVNFLPAIKQEEKTRKLIAPKLSSVYSYMSHLIAMIEHDAETQRLEIDKSIDALDNLIFYNDLTYCKQKYLMNGKENSMIDYSYNLLKDSDKYRNLILKTCDELVALPCITYCNENIVQIISKIQLSEMLELLYNSNDKLIKHDFIQPRCHQLGKYFQEFKLMQYELGNFFDEKRDYEFITITEQERAKQIKSEQELLEKHPELSKIILLQNEDQ